MWSSTWTCNMHSQSRKSNVSWSASTDTWSAGWGSWYSPSTLLFGDPTWIWSQYLQYCAHLWDHQHEEHMDLLEKIQRMDTKMIRETDLSPMRKGWESWGCSPGEEKTPTFKQPSSTQMGLTGEMKRFFSKRHVRMLGWRMMALFWIVKVCIRY